LTTGLIPSETRWTEATLQPAETPGRIGRRHHGPCAMRGAGQRERVL